MQGRVGTLVGVCTEAPTYSPRLTGCQELPVSRKWASGLVKTLLGSSSTPAPSSLYRQLSPLPLLYLTFNCAPLSQEAHQWVVLPLSGHTDRWDPTAPFPNTQNMKDFPSWGEMAAVPLLRAKLEEMGFAWSLPDPG